MQLNLIVSQVTGMTPLAARQRKLLATTQVRAGANCASRTQKEAERRPIDAPVYNEKSFLSMRRPNPFCEGGSGVVMTSSKFPKSITMTMSHVPMDRRRHPPNFLAQALLCPPFCISNGELERSAQSGRDMT